MMAAGILAPAAHQSVHEHFINMSKPREQIEICTMSAGDCMVPYWLGSAKLQHVRLGSSCIYGFFRQLGCLK